MCKFSIIVDRRKISFYFSLLVFSSLVIPTVVAFNPDRTNFLNNNATQQTELVEIWNNTIGGSFDDNAKSLVKCTTGGYLFSGWTNSSGLGDYDIWLMRTDNSGQHIWNVTIGTVEEDKGYQVINCQTGGFALISTYTNTSAAITNTDVLISRVANNGSILWNKYYSGPKQDDITHFVGDLGRSLLECPNGDFVFAGVTSPVAGVGADVWISRIQQDGTTIWERTFDHWTTDRCYTPHSIVRCSDGGFALACYTYDATESNDVWLIRTNSLGYAIWNETFGDATGYQRPEGLVECADGGFAIIANTQSFGAGQADAWVIRTDSLGKQLWNETYGGTEQDSGSQILKMANGDFTFCGGTHSFDQGQGDGWLVRIDSLGAIIWNHTFGDEFGKSATSFVFEGNDTYTIAGGTRPVGENFGKVWLVKIRVQPKNIPTNNTTNSTNFQMLYSVLLVIPILLLKKKERRKSPKKIVKE
jgi:hypothetical protein